MQGCRLPGLLHVQSFSLGWARQKGQTQGSHPTLTPLPRGAHVHWHSALICALSSSFLPTPFGSFVTSWQFTVLFVLFLLFCLYLNFLFFIIPWIYLHSHQSVVPPSSLGAEQHTGKIWRASWHRGAAHCPSILNSRFASYVQDNIRCWLTWIKEKNPVLLH